MPAQHLFDDGRPIRWMGRFGKEADSGGELVPQLTPDMLFDFRKQAERQAAKLRLGPDPFEQFDSRSVSHFCIADDQVRKRESLALRKHAFAPEITFSFLSAEQMAPFCRR